MNYSPALLLSLLIFTGCNGTPAATEGTTEQSDAQVSTQQDELAKQKLTIEQAAEEATKLVEADAKAEIEAAVPTGTEPAQ
jgi:deoxycytidylate deaminase